MASKWVRIIIENSDLKGIRSVEIGCIYSSVSFTRVTREDRSKGVLDEMRTKASWVSGVKG